jgi:hypothetical protein
MIHENGHEGDGDGLEIFSDFLQRIYIYSSEANKFNHGNAEAPRKFEGGVCSSMSSRNRTEF